MAIKLKSSPPTRVTSAPSRWFPTQNQLKDPDSLERAFRQALNQHYSLQDRMSALASADTTQAGAASSNGTGPVDSMMLGLRVRPVDTQTLADGDVLTFVKKDGNLQFKPGGGGGSGTVTSVGLTVPAEFSVSGSPVTTSGTLAVTKATETANTFWAGPTSGPAAVPTFRAITSTDITLVVGLPVENEIVTFSGTSGTLAHTPSSVTGYTQVKLYRNGVRQVPGGGNDYTWSGTAVTLSVAAGGGDVFIADYYQ